MSDATRKWLNNAISDGLVEWAAACANDGTPSPDEHEQAVYRLAFTAGADAALVHVAEILTREE
jgi:hypothetical protein